MTHVPGGMMCVWLKLICPKRVVHKELGVEFGGTEVIESVVDMGKDRAP